jgi:hypothetical protein
MIKAWAREALAKGQQVVVMIGYRTIVILPDRDVDFGMLAPDEIIVMGEAQGIAGPVYEPLVVKQDTDVGKAIGAAQGTPVMVRDETGEKMRRGRILA